MPTRLIPYLVPSLFLFVSVRIGVSRFYCCATFDGAETRNGYMTFMYVCSWMAYEKTIPYHQIHSYMNVTNCKLIFCPLLVHFPSSFLRRLTFSVFRSFGLFGHKSGVRVKNSNGFYLCFPFPNIILQNRGCLGSRDRDQLQPALTTLTN